MKTPIEKLRLLVLGLILPGVGCMVYGHLEKVFQVKTVGMYLVVASVVASLAPLLMVVLTSLFSKKK